MNQLHITSEYIELLDNLSKCNINTYKKLLTFAENVNIERMKYRLNQYYAISSLDSDKKIIDFENFIDLECFILENYNLFVLATTDISYWSEFKYLNLFEKANELFSKYIKELTGSNKDKIIKLIKEHEHEGNRHQKYTLRNLLENLVTWYKTSQEFKFFGFDLEKFDKLKSFSLTVQRANKIKNAYLFFKLIKPELSKNIDRKNFLNLYFKLKKENDFYMPLIEHSHKYTDPNLFFQHLLGMEITLKMKEVMDSLEKYQIKLIHYDSDRKVVIAHIETFEQVQKVGASSWCLTNHRSDWNSYTRDAYFIMYWIFGNENIETSVHGICLRKSNLQITHCQNKNNSSIKSHFHFNSEEQNEMNNYFLSYKTTIEKDKYTKALTTKQLDNEIPNKSFLQKIFR